MTPRSFKAPHFPAEKPKEPDAAERALLEANRLVAAGDLQGSLAYFDQALLARPAYPQAWGNRGVALRRLLRIEEALASFDEALRLAPHYAEARWNRSMALLLVGRFEEGWVEYEWRKRIRRPLGIRAVSGQAWTGNVDLAGRSVFIHGEQGLGDTLQFSRYLPDLVQRGARVTAEVQAPLVELLQRQWPDLRVISPALGPPQTDLNAALLSLPGALAQNGPAFSHAHGYLTPSQERVAHWRDWVAPSGRPVVGLAWSGDPGHANDARRSIALAALGPLLAVDVDWIALQPDIRASDETALAAHSQLRAPRRAIRDFEDTAALVSLTSLVITVDTSIAHLSGALGHATWIALPALHDWRWQQHREDSPWYRSVRLFRQSDDELNWYGVVDRLAAELAARPHLP